VDRHAVAGQNVPAVVIQEGRHKVHLDVGPVIGGMFADDEAARLRNIGTAGALFSEQVTQANHEVTELIVGDGLLAVDQRANIQVVLKVGAHTRQVKTGLDAVCFQVAGGPDA